MSDPGAEAPSRWTPAASPSRAASINGPFGKSDHLINLDGASAGDLQLPCVGCGRGRRAIARPVNRLMAAATGIDDGSLVSHAARHRAAGIAFAAVVVVPLGCGLHSMLAYIAARQQGLSVLSPGVRARLLDVPASSRDGGGAAAGPGEAAVACAKALGSARQRPGVFCPASVVNVSAMSFGALGGVAVEAVNRGCALAGCLR